MVYLVEPLITVVVVNGSMHGLHVALLGYTHVAS